jgi:hypothetical protein
MDKILKKLAGGDRRSIGKSNEVARVISRSPRLFALVFEAMLRDDCVLRMRAADAIEKAAAMRPELLQPFKAKLLRKVSTIKQQEVRWHVAQMLPRLRLTARQRDFAAAILFDYLEDKSSIVRTFAMQALAELAMQYGRLRSRVFPLLERLAVAGTPAMRSRGRKLLNLLPQ